jgi:hypothetical protein
VVHAGVGGDQIRLPVDVAGPMAPWITGAVDAPDTYVALDNVVLSVIPETPSVTLALAGLLLWLGRVRTRFRT